MEMIEMRFHAQNASIPNRLVQLLIVRIVETADACQYMITFERARRFGWRTGGKAFPARHYCGADGRLHRLVFKVLIR